MILLIMGVSGCGKTTLGEKTAEGLKIDYFEADKFHPSANIEKMASGIPLNDADRWPWLALIREKAAEYQAAGKSAVITCSALKESYRQYLGEGLTSPLEWVYLKGSFEVIESRMSSRKGHYFKAEMLKSQFADLEEPEYGLILNIEDPLEEKVQILLDRFKGRS
ncbi:gluconokinase [Oceanispirochaeta sp.]|uniref:gluconokinase n=1 Tax=Oceanispirochaeta sp. TaxID=2035350 RepID=UPI0026190138|nr:gluconokinase [Oceanispirochaeta sp.]MDA3956815.1 gluconokinase [Oceanispirochaeta sp.]